MGAAAVFETAAATPPTVEEASQHTKKKYPSMLATRPFK